MDSDSGDQKEMFVVKIETDVAEEPPSAWGTGKVEQGERRTVASSSHMTTHRYMHDIA